MIAELSDMFRRNQQLFINCLADVSDEAAAVRPSADTNSIAFLALHLVDVRFFLAEYLRVDVHNPYAERLRNARGIDDVGEIPPLVELTRVWRDLSARIEPQLARLTEQDLATPSGRRFPMTAATHGGGIVFLLQHEMYHIGQMALLRKYVGRDAMRWSEMLPRA